MAKLFFKQLTILLWKCWIMRRRHYISTIFEILSPLILTIAFAKIYGTSSGGESSGGIQIFPPTISVHNHSIVVQNSYSNPNYEIHYCPDNDKFTSDIMNHVNMTKSLTVISHKTETEINDYVRAQMSNQQHKNTFASKFVGVIFNTDSKNEKNFKYTIRVISYRMSSMVAKLFPDKYQSGAATSSPYTDFGFSPVQILINEAYLDGLTHDGNDRKLKYDSIQTYRFPFPKFSTTIPSFNGFFYQDFISMCIVIGYITMAALIVKRITDEKAAKAKEMLRMMGMSDWVFWGSHFINYFTVMLFQNIFFTVSYCYGYGGTAAISFSNKFLFFVIVQLYCTQAILFCMLITTVFNRPIIAVVVTVIVWVVTFGVPYALQNPGFNTSMDVLSTNAGRIVTSFLPNMGITWCISIITQFELYNIGVNFSNLWAHSNLYGSFTVGTAMLMMLIACIVYSILIWYIDAIWPWQYGVPKPVYFPFTASYWCSGKRADANDNVIGNEKNDPSNFEAEPNIPVGISTVGLHKEFGGFKSERKTAVENVSLNIYNGQITVLLGHNGAGKTTTMNMITGIFPPTRGVAFVDGYNVNIQTKKARMSMSLCPQENIIYNELTVEEHLKLYAIMKDYPWSNVNIEVQKTLELLRLTDKKHALASSLSGGMKRKLSLGIALIGDTKILVLDEPTSGMDPEARRAVWDLLQSIRSERTILLTTHYMEEADILGDRIAIMSEGIVSCCGSPMFLKKRFGAGYHLRLAKASDFNAQIVDKIIHRHLNHASLKNDIHSEVVYSLEDVNDESNEQKTQISSNLPDLFDDLENNREKLGVESYGLSITTMEDVFLRVGNEFGGMNEKIILNNGNNNRYSHTSLDNLLRDSNHRVNGFNLTLQRFKGLLFKRFHFARRYWPMIIFQVLLPGILFMAVLIADRFIRASYNSNSIDLQLNLKNLYGNTEGFYMNKLNQYKEFDSVYQNIAKSDKYGINEEILNDSTDPNQWALSPSHSGDLNNYIKKYLIGGAINKTYDGIVLSPWYNNEAAHAIPLSINLMYEALANYETNEKISISVNNHPYNTDDFMNDYTSIIVGWAVSCLLLTPITVPFIGASYVLFAINEHTSKAKLLQIMTGLSSLTFWAANFLFDLINHLIAMIVIFIVFLIFDHNKVFFGQMGTAIGLFLMLFLFGFASIPLAYCFSYWLKKPSTGFAVLVIIYLLFGLIVNIVMSVVDLSKNTFNSDSIFSNATFNALLGIFRLVPVFSMNFGIQKLYKLGAFTQMCNKMETENPFVLKSMCMNIYKSNPYYGCCPEKCKITDNCFVDRQPLKFDAYGVAPEFLYMLIDGLLFMLILWLLEGNIQKFWYRYKQRSNKTPLSGMAMVAMNPNLGPIEDSDVTAERQRIMHLYESGTLKHEAMGVIDLTKQFNGLTAVDHLTFGVHKEECFGFLGVNGAGKTTTFRMLTGDLFVSDGNAQIEYETLCRNLHLFQQQIGYCPQFDALLNKLTGREMLFLFARLRGLTESTIPSNVENIIEMVDLKKHADKCTEEYSGGNRRKLSLGLAIIGTPPVIFLDEPTSGVDPAARRKIWSTLVHIREKYQSAIVLTSHSMEECEALCSRIAIMVNGRFQCLGSTQHLRTKYGQGFTVVIKIKRELNDDPNYISNVQNYVMRALPSAQLKDSHQCLLHYHITDTSVKWSHIFRVMESAKDQLQFEDYYVSDTTLEQIFLHFARSQRI